MFMVTPFLADEKSSKKELENGKVHRKGTDLRKRRVIVVAH